MTVEAANLPELTQRAILLVRQQLHLLHEAWGPGVTTQEVYALAGHLRALLHDGAFSWAWGIVWPETSRPKATVVAPDLSLLLPAEFWPYIVHAQSAGLAVPGVHLWMPVAFRAMPDELSDRLAGLRPQASGPGAVDRTQVDRVGFGLRGAAPSGLIDQEGVPVEPPSCYRRFRLSRYLSSPCLVHNGKAISRRHLVKIFAEKMGSAHIEWKNQDHDYEALTSPGRWLRLSGRNPALLEVLSIGQTLVRSSAARMFCERVDELGLDPSLL